MHSGLRAQHILLITASVGLRRADVEVVAHEAAYDLDVDRGIEAVDVVLYVAPVMEGPATCNVAVGVWAVEVDEGVVVAVRCHHGELYGLGVQAGSYVFEQLTVVVGEVSEWGSEVVGVALH